jgi:hypothetical protein
MNGQSDELFQAFESPMNELIQEHFAESNDHIRKLVAWLHAMRTRTRTREQKLLSRKVSSLRRKQSVARLHSNRSHLRSQCLIGLRCRSAIAAAGGPYR